MVVVDRLTKYAHFLALAHPFSAKDVAQLFVKEVVRLHGFPKAIISDRDPVFLSHFWSELFKQAGTKLKYSTSYHPQTDGQTEVTNRCLETYLRCFVSSRPKQWVVWLAWAEYWFNTSFNASTQLSPFQALYGRSPPILFRGETYPSKVLEVQALVATRDEVLAELKDNLSLAQQRMKFFADQRRREVQFELGDWVFLKFQPYRMRSLARKPNEKLSPRFYGPYQILQRVGPVAYRLALPPTCRLHPVFHISRLKKAVPPQQQPQELPAGLSEEGILQTEPERLLDIRTTPAGATEVLVKWLDLPDCENSWELLSALQSQFPAVHLEDKVALLGGSSVRSQQFGQVYVRRNRQNKGVGQDMGPIVNNQNSIN